MVVAGIVFTATGAAQGSKLQFGFGAGRSLPTGDYHAAESGEGFDAGWMGMAFVALKASPRFSLRFDGAYGSNDGNDQLNAHLTTALGEAAEATTKLRGASFDLTYSLAEGARASPYVLGGIGMYHITIAVMSHGTTTDDSGTNFAWNLGAGLAYRVGRAALFIEARHVSAGSVSGFPATTFFPIIAGGRFGAP